MVSKPVANSFSVEREVVAEVKLGDFGSCELPKRQKASTGTAAAPAFCSSRVQVPGTLWPAAGGWIPMSILLATLWIDTWPPLPLALRLIRPGGPTGTQPTTPAAPARGDVTLTCRFAPAYRTKSCRVSESSSKTVKVKCGSLPRPAAPPPPPPHPPLPPC